MTQTFTYKALMLSDVPNFAFIIGYSNASWTLKADLVCEYVVRLLEHMDQKNLKVVIPRKQEGLEPAPEGFYYEAWLRNRAVQRISI